MVIKKGGNLHVHVHVHEMTSIEWNTGTKLKPLFDMLVKYITCRYSNRIVTMPVHGLKSLFSVMVKGSCKRL